MANDFEARVVARLDTSELERELNSLQNKKTEVKFNLNSGNASKDIDKINSSIKTARTNTQTFGQTLKSALNISSAAAVTVQGIRLVRQAANEATEAIKDYDAAIADIRTVTGNSYSAASEMVKQYNQIGQALGATTKEVSNSGVTWLRQGRTIQETNTLLNDSIVLAKIGFIDEADSAQYLTSAINGYKIAVEGAAGVIDKLAALDSAAAVTAGGLAEGMSRTAVTANNMGISMDRLLGYLTAIGNVNPNLDMTAIGNSMKTIFTRMSNIKAGKLELIDEDGTVEILSDVETVLNNAGIKLRDSQNEFRNFGEVLDEVGAAWDTYSSVQQAAIAKAFAGTRQQENFRVLMDNYQSAIDFANLAADSAGTAEQKFAAYLDSIEAKSKSLQAAFESLATNTVSTEAYAGIIDATTALVQFLDKTNIVKGTLAGLATAGAIKGFTSLATGIANAAVKLNDFNSAIAIVKAGNIGDAEIQQLAKATANLSSSQLKAVLSSTALSTEQRIAILTTTGLSEAEAKAQLEAIGLTTAQDTAAASTFSLSGAFKGLWATLAANPLVLVVAAVTATVAAISTYERKLEEARQATYDAADAAIDEANNIAELSTAYRDAQEAYANNTGSKEDLTAATDNLLAALGVEREEIENLIAEYGSLDAAINQVTADSLKTSMRETRDAALAAQEKFRLDILSSGGAIGDTTSIKFGLDDTSKNMARVLSDYGVDVSPESTNILNHRRVQIYDGLIDSYEEALDAYQTILDIENAIEDAYANGDLSGDYVNTSFYKSLEARKSKIIDSYEDVTGYYRELNKQAAEYEYLMGGFDAPKTQEEYDALRKSMLDAAESSVYFEGSQADITAAIDDFLGTLPGVTEYVEAFATSTEAAVESAAQSIIDTASGAATATQEVMNAITAAQNLMAGQKTGESISLADYNSDELKDFTSALEYHNGTLQLNAEKVQEIIEAKSQEQIAINDTNKAMAQSKYLQNAKEIEQLRQKIIDKNFAEGESADSIQDTIDYLLDENSAIKSSCDAYDIMSASLREATDAYHNWLNAQSAAQSGDMFDDTLNAINRINDTLNNANSEYYGRVGRTDYQAALGLIIPDSVNTEDEAAINSYLDSIYSLFTYDDSGNRAGLNIENFCEQAVDAGLMVLDEATDSYQIAGQKTMEDFAEGMNLSLPLVQAMFGEMEEFGGEFSWADEAVKTIGDLGVAAVEAGEKLRAIEGNEDLIIRMDVSDIESGEEKLAALDETIAQMQDLKSTVDVDSSEIEYANEIIRYCVAQKQALSEPLVMSVDTSAISDNMAAAISLIQEFQRASNELEVEKSLGLDTTAAQANVDSLAAEVSALDPNILATLEIDTSSMDSIASSIAAISGENLVKLGIDDSAILGYTAETKEADVVYGVDDTAVKNYTPANKTATVTYLRNSYAVDYYNPRNLTRYVTYYTRTVGTQSVNGTAHVAGTAFAGGDWGTAPGGSTLVGELGREIVVNPYTGKWYTVGDSGAEFVNIPPGSIVFNHRQTDALLRYGYVAGRASALAGGTAMVTGGIKRDYATRSISSGGNSTSGNYSSSSSGSSSKSSSRSSSSSSTSDDTKTVDWIEKLIKRIESAIQNLQQTATSSFKTLKDRASATVDEMMVLSDEIATQQAAYERYMEQANSVGLSADLAQKVREGAVDISEYDKNTGELIQDYTEWIEKAYDAADAVAKLHNDLASLYDDNFQNIKTDYENQLGLYTHLSNVYSDYLDTLELKGRLASTEIYTALQKTERHNISILEKELKDLTRSMSEAINSGEIDEGSEKWYEYQDAINEVKESIDKANNSLLEYAKTMRELEWSYFDFTQDRIEQIIQESDFISGILSGDNVDAQGNFTNTGLTNLGLHGMNYNVYMNQADQYAKEIKKLNKEIANDPYNTDLIARREKLLKLQQNSIEAAEDEKDAMVSLVEEGIKAQLDALKDLIDAYETSLNSSKDLHDYQKKIDKQTSNIASIQKQISAYANDDSQENVSRLQKLNQELISAQEELEETQYDQYIKDQKKLLDDLYLEYETILNTRLDDVDLLISELIDEVNFNADTINTTINNAAKSVGYTLSSELSGIWTQAAAVASDIKAAINGSDTSSLACKLINALASEGVLSAQQAQQIKNAINGGDNSLATKLVNQLVANGTLSSTDAGLIVNAMNGENGESVAKRILSTTGAITDYNSNFTNTMTTTNAAINGIKAYTDSLKQKSEEEAAAKIADTTTTTEVDKSIIPATQNGQSTTTTTTTTPTTETKKSSAPSLSVGSSVYLKSGTWWRAASDGTGAKGSADYWLGGKSAKITKINNASWATHPYLIGSYGWVRKSDIVGYKTGGMDYYTGLAMLHGTATKPEAVLNSEDTQNLLNLRDELRNIGKQPLTVQNSASHVYTYGDRFGHILSGILTGIQPTDTRPNVGDINVNIGIDHVDDYNDLVKKLQNDKQFERMVEAMSIDKVTGKSAMRKYGVKFN